MLVTIEGVINSNLIQEGDRREVTWTPRLATLAQNGVIRVIVEPVAFDNGGIAAGKGLMVKAATVSEIVVVNNTPDTIEMAIVTDELPVPGRNGKREDWQAFLTSEGIVYDLSDTRDELIGRWETHGAGTDPAE